MYKALLSSIFALIFPANSNAATWYTFNNVLTDTKVYFFDMDTIQRQGDTVTIWIKYVTDPAVPDTDGSFATASKWSYLCGKRTAQILTSVTYDKAGKFIKTFPNPSLIMDIIPDSVGEAVLKTVCASDFPKNKSQDFYFLADGNDVFRHTARFFDQERAKNSDPAPK